MSPFPCLDCSSAAESVLMAVSLVYLARDPHHFIVGFCFFVESLGG